MHWLVVLLFVYMGVESSYSQYDSTSLRFNYDNLRKVKFSPKVAKRLSPMEKESGPPCGKAVSIDLNKDGVVDYFVDCMSGGTCGVNYYVFDGRSGTIWAEFCAGQVFVLSRRINGMPVIETTSHMSVNETAYDTWVFNGKKYVEVSFARLEGKSLDLFFEDRKDILFLK